MSSPILGPSRRSDYYPSSSEASTPFGYGLTVPLYETNTGPQMPNYTGPLMPNVFVSLTPDVAEQSLGVMSIAHHVIRSRQ